MNKAMAVVPDISEATVINFLQSKGLRPEGTSGGKMPKKRVFTGRRLKTPKKHLQWCQLHKLRTRMLRHTRRMGHRRRVLHQMK